MKNVLNVNHLPTFIFSLTARKTMNRNDIYFINPFHANFPILPVLPVPVLPVQLSLTIKNQFLNFKIPLQIYQVILI